MLGNLVLPPTLTISGELTANGYVVTYSSGGARLVKRYPSPAVPKIQLAKDLSAALDHLAAKRSA